jgi:uncharacterized protein (TIGR03067 family)
MDRKLQEIAEEMQKLQGNWKQIAYERNGVVEPEDERGWNPTTAFTGDRFVVTLADGSTPIRGIYRIDPTTSPKRVDWMDEIGPDAGKTILAIYKLEGCKFTFCAAEPGHPRPTEFRTRQGQVLRVSVREEPSTAEMRK